MSILLFLLASASENTAFFDRHYSLLVGICILVATALLLLVSLMLYRLYKRYKRGKFGVKLTSKLVLLFALMGILPGAVIYMVSVQFVSRSIESWFDVRVETALDSGVKLAQSMLETSRGNLTSRATRLSTELSGMSPQEQSTLLASRFRNTEGDIQAMVINSNGRVLASSETDLSAIEQNLPPPSVLEQLEEPYSAIEGAMDNPDTPENEQTRLSIRVIVPVNGQEHAYLQLFQPIPENIATNAESLRAAYSEYQIRSVSRSGLQKMYIVTLSLTLLLAIFGATATAFQLAANLARPLLLLAQGTKAVAEGNLSPRPIVASTDELGTLTKSFNTMTLQLAEARSSAEKSRTELETAKAYLESVMTNMSAGVIGFDNNFKLTDCNDPASRILKLDLKPFIGTELSKIDGIEHFVSKLIQAFTQLSAQQASGNTDEDFHLQQQIEIPLPSSPQQKESNQTLLARGSSHYVNGENHYIVVFDDITELISAQRSIAWGEVARRLAHEIKNPLTPIQLAAERLQMKLNGKLEDQEAGILKRSTDTIVNQVTAMKQMVDDFRNYAKAPPATLVPLDLNALVEEISHLYANDGAMNIVHPKLAEDLPEIMGDATRLRQVIHNLLQNALDACNEVTDRPDWQPNIEIMTEKVHYTDASGKICIAVRLSVMDNGLGFSQEIMSRIFEPYVTTKERGTGLGMAVVKKIIEEHDGRIDLHNRTDIQGADVSILFMQLAPEKDNMVSQQG